MPFTILGIDPGKYGAMASFSFSEGGLELVGLSDFPLTRRDRRIDFPRLAEIVQPYQNPETGEPKTFAALEWVTSFGQGRTSAFHFGENLGAWQAVLASHRIPCQLITPQSWKRGMGILGEDKESALFLARELFPGWADALARKKDLDRADAILLGLFYAKKNTPRTESRGE